MNGIKLFNDLMEYADGKGASDVHLVPGRTAMLRIDGELTAAGQEDAAEWQDADLTEVTEQILSGDQLEEYRTKGALVCSYSFSKALRLRVSVYRQQGRDAMSVRLHPAGVPMPEKLLLPEEITELVKNGRGLLLVTGGRGRRWHHLPHRLQQHSQRSLSLWRIRQNTSFRREGDWLCSGRSERTALPGRKPLRWRCSRMPM